MALDGEKRPVPTLTSNAGHLLWSGIVPAGHAERLAAHLMGDRLFSGWGVRTLAEGQLAYNRCEPRLTAPIRTLALHGVPGRSGGPLRP